METSKTMDLLLCNGQFLDVSHFFTQTLSSLLTKGYCIWQRWCRKKTTQEEDQEKEEGKDNVQALESAMMILIHLKITKR